MPTPPFKSFVSGSPSATVSVLEATPAGQRGSSETPRDTLFRQGNRKKTRKGKIPNSNQRNALQIRALEKEVAAKLAEARQLELDQHQLHVEHQLLLECCDGLELLRLQYGGSGEIDQEELALLEQLQNISYGQAGCNSSSSAWPRSRLSATEHYSAVGSGFEDGAAAAAAAAGHPQQLLLSPADDRMYYFRYMLSLPPFPGAQQLTVQDLAADYASTVHVLALQLLLVDKPSQARPYNAAALGKIKAVIDRHFNIIKTLILQQRSDLMETFMLTNFETLEVSEEVCTDKLDWIIKAAGVTAEQRITVAQGMELFSRLLARLTNERRHLQQQIAVMQQHEHGGASYRQQLDRQGQQLQRLQLLLRKDYLTKIALAGWILGAFSYVQIATMAIQNTPFPVCLTLLAKALVVAEKSSGSSSS